MSKYIDADKLKKQFEEVNIKSGQTEMITRWLIKTNIDKAPHIDIVFCKECKWDKAQMIPKEVKCIYQHNADDFCSYGEREGE